MNALPSISAEPDTAWTLHVHATVASTNDLAATLPPWHAVVAERQTAGRGRHGREWVSDSGGLWLSAVLPTPGPAATWSLLPLAAGWAIRSALTQLGVAGVRLRWPNDVMIGRAKLAGILVERFCPDAVVVGLGLNCTNTPDVADPKLAGLATRLADHLTPLPPREQILHALLVHLAQAQAHVAAGHHAQLMPALDAAWASPRVVITLRSSGREITGTLVGVNAQGDLRLRTPGDNEQVLSSREVELLRELG